jgi:hypothetical protein
VAEEEAVVVVEVIMEDVEEEVEEEDADMATLMVAVVEVGLILKSGKLLFCLL